MDLQAKFEALELQVGNQHADLMAALSTIAYALGAPPAAPTFTIETLSTNLIAINNNLIGIAIANGTFHAAMLNAMALINVNTDTLITNNSLNAQRMLSAILSTACACPATVPFLESPLDVTPTDLVGEAKCRRIQFYLAIFGTMVDGIANYGGAGAMVTAAAITEIMYAAALTGGLIGGETGVVAGPPGIALGAIVGIIGAAIGALGSSYLFTLSAQWHTSPLYDQLLEALYAANSADQGTEAFYAVINASAVLNLPFKPLLNALWWNDWSNEIYSGLPVVDDSDFDGTICAPSVDETCIVQNVPGDEGTSNYTFEGDTYSRVTVEGVSFHDRVTNDTTMQPTVRCTCSFGGLVAYVEADELITWSDLYTRIGGAYPTYIDSNAPAPSGFTIEWCNLAPL